MEFLVFVNKNAAACEHLSVQLAPNGLGPTGVGYGQVASVFLYIVPKAGGDDMTQGIGIIVGHHFGLSGGAGGKVEVEQVAVF